MAKIGELLIAGGHLTQEGLEEALDWQVLYGGRLGTNLLELQLVTEEQLAHALGKQLGAEVAFGNLDLDPTVVSAIPRHIADRQEIVPWKLEKRRLKVLCCAPDVATFDQLSSKIGRPCVPVVAPEFRIFQLLRAHYSATRQMRALDFGVVPEEGREQRRKKKEKQKGNVVEDAPELIDESAFNDIYNQVVAGRSQAPPQMAWTTPPQGVPPVAPPGYQLVPNLPPPPPGYQYAPIPQPPQQPAPSWTSQSARPAGPPVMTPQQPAAPPPAEEKLEQLPADAILEELPADAIMGEARAAEAAQAEAEIEAEGPLKPVAWDEPAPPAQPARDESPLDFKQALKALDGVTDRDSIAHIVLRASRSKAARALLLQVQGGVALGWDGLGEGLDDGQASQVEIPLSAESAFALVVKTRGHYMGPLQKTPLNIRFLATLGKKVPLSSLLFPILHRGRV
ncbi:MAG: hypothetical protein LC689_08075, partial [Myxococcales bacterium]|nr:hypothetical protein [Myxococcales bacterium]